jgi:hypothetical protein
VCSKVKITAKSFHRTQTNAKARFDTRGTQNAEKVAQYVHDLKEVMPDDGPTDKNASSRWNRLRDIYNAAKTNFGKNTRKSSDWYEAHAEEILLLIKNKRCSYII